MAGDQKNQFKEKTMKTKAPICLFCLFLLCLCLIPLSTGAETSNEEETKVLILWTSGDREVAQNMVFMYAFNAKKYGWLKTIRLIVWGPSARLLSDDVELQNEIKKMKTGGVELLACKACSDRYGVSEKLAGLGIEVKYVGKDLTAMINEGWTILTF
jgi:hypothetical protein